MPIGKFIDETAREITITLDTYTQAIEEAIYYKTKYQDLKNTCKSASNVYIVQEIIKQEEKKERDEVNAD